MRIHAGLCVPPKCVAIEEAESACKEFVEGDLLEQSIQPLEVCARPKTFEPCDFDAVTDPTPTATEAVTDNDHDHRKKQNGFSFR